VPPILPPVEVCSNGPTFSFSISMVIPAMRPPIISFGDTPDVVADVSGKRSTKSGSSSNAVTAVRMVWILYHVPDHSSAFAVNVPDVIKYAVESNVRRWANNDDEITFPLYCSIGRTCNANVSFDNNLRIGNAVPLEPLRQSCVPVHAEPLYAAKCPD